MEIVHKVHIDLALVRNTEQLSMVQYDSNSRIIENHLYSNSAKWKIPEGTVAKLFAQKPSGKFVYQDAEYVDNVVKASLHNQVLAENGLVYYQFELTNGDEVLSTFAGIIDVKNSLSNECAEESATIVPEFERLTEEKIEEIKLAAQTEIEKILTHSELEQSHITEKTNYSINEIENKKDEVLEDIQEKGNQTLNSIPSDYIEINTRLEQAEKSIKEKAPAIVCDEKGSAISVSDASDDYVRGLNLFGKTVQNGTPTPYAPIPLESVGDGGSVGVTVCGKNLLATPYNTKFGTYTGVTFSDAGNGNVEIDGTATEATNFFFVNYMTGKRRAIKAGTYTISGNTSPNIAMSFFVYESQDVTNYLFATTIKYREPKTITLENDAYFGFYIRVDKDVTVSNIVVSPQIELGSTATEYEPYKGQTLTASTPNGLHGIPVTSGGNYTDENGQQWIADYRDWERGVDVQRVGEKTFDGSADEGWKVGTYNFFINVPDFINTKANVLCNTHTSNNEVATTNLAIHEVCQGVTFTNVCFGNPNDAVSLEEWKTALAETPITIRYPLETPIETPIPEEELAAYRALHTNYPNTTVYNDAGAGMKLEYNADTKTYIDNKFAELAAALVNNV